MIQYNIIQDQTEDIFLYCITLAINPTQPTAFQLSRACTKTFKFHCFYKPFETCDVGAAARALFLQNGQYFIGFISNYEKSESNCSLTGPELKCYSRLKHFKCFDATYQITTAKVMVM